jgi:predicted esterase YcpF (UPF0227 family)
MFNHITSSEVQDYYNNNSNYKIVSNNNSNDTTIVYCSSNGIYFPNDYETFNNTIVKRNRYEWSKSDNQFKNANKIIYIRDVYKQWYLKGINKDINSFEKIANLIRKEHTNKKLILVGISAGGYIAIILGLMLNADAVYSFAGQFTLEPILKEAKEKNKDKFVIEMYDIYKRYYNLGSLLEKSKVDIFYFVCKNSTIDIEDIKIASKYDNINKFYFDCDNHGVPFHTTLLQKILSMKKENLVKVSREYKDILINPRIFWNNFFTKIEYIFIFGLFILKNSKKIPKHLLIRIKGLK